MNVVAIVQARMGSSRLPGKVLTKIGDHVLIELLLNRLAKAKSLSKIVLATTNDRKDDELVSFVKALNVCIYRGSKDDVLGRYFQTALRHNADVIVRITGDCPLVDPALVDVIVKKFMEKKVDYVSNTIEVSYPDGLDVEVFSFSALKRAHKEATTEFDREHVTPYLKSNKHISKHNVSSNFNYSSLRWTVDEIVDLKIIEEILSLFDGNTNFSWQDIVNNPKFGQSSSANISIPRNEGATMSKGQKLWRRAKAVIPGGNMLLSKRPEMFLPDKWPAYFSKAKGCNVWDLDGKKYIDVSIMGIGTNLLGYGHEKVDGAVMRAIDSGNMSTLNCPEEVLLAEKLIDLHPWSDMVRFARTGGEANAIAVRIARAASGKPGVAICGYHGWHDWYLASNLTTSSALTQHLLPGLEPNGVPQSLIGSTHAFPYNDIQRLEYLIQTEDIGVVVMEVMRNAAPQNNFLSAVRDLTSKNGVVLIFDECTSGFRETYGGLHKKFNVSPDMAMFGKALGNGYAITAVIGSRDVMEYAQSSFISSTFWTEKIGPSAALETLKVMDEMKSWDVVTELGNHIKQTWQILAGSHSIEIIQTGLPALASFSFKNEPLVSKTFFTQEMLKRGYLASNSFYPSTAHCKQTLDLYFENCNDVFALISSHMHSGDLIDSLETPICQSGFSRLN